MNRFQVPPLDEALWRRADANYHRRLRGKLLRSGVIRSSAVMKPQLLVRDSSVKGGWRPEIVRYEELPGG